MNLDFKNELAAKLNAGANFGGFGGPRRPVSQISSPDPSGTPGLKDFTRVAVPSSPSPGTPPDSPLVTDENLSSEKPSTSSYMESAMLRINLNKQRKHRPATRFANQQSAPQALMATSDISFTSPLDNIVEEENLSPSVFQDTAIPSKSAVAVTTKLRHRNSDSSKTATRRTVSGAIYDLHNVPVAREPGARRHGSSSDSNYPSDLPVNSTPRELKSVIKIKDIRNRVKSETSDHSKRQQRPFSCFSDISLYNQETIEHSD